MCKRPFKAMIYQFQRVKKHLEFKPIHDNIDDADGDDDDYLVVVVVVDDDDTDTDGDDLY